MRKFLFTFLCSFYLCITLSGCTRYIEKKVLVPVPVKCQVPVRERPHSDKEDPEFLKKILIYVEQLENDINFCINGE